LTDTSSVIWHPFTQHALRSRLPKAVRADGAYIFTADGRRIVDAISSWWVITHGHRHPRIVAAIRAAADTLDQVIFAEYTERLAEKLLAVAAPGLAHVFFSDSGSTSVEVALKMALGFWRHGGAPRHRILVMEHSYHGDTVGAMSVGERGPFTAAYEPLLFDVARIPFPMAGRESATFAALEAHCRADRRHAHVFAGRARRAPQYLREARRAFHRRRGDDRLGPHRHHVRVRAGRHLTRHRLLFQRSDRRLIASGGDALPP
jgi:adenosylmethionine-8-amino-7-oxononanoate aminotransferase